MEMKKEKKQQQVIVKLKVLRSRTDKKKIKSSTDFLNFLVCNLSNSLIFYKHSFCNWLW